jgi:hypothetical protein
MKESAWKPVSVNILSAINKKILCTFEKNIKKQRITFKNELQTEKSFIVDKYKHQYRIRAKDAISFLYFVSFVQRVSSID